MKILIAATLIIAGMISAPIKALAFPTIANRTPSVEQHAPSRNLIGPIFQIRSPLQNKNNPLQSVLHLALTSVGTQIIKNSKIKEMPLTLFNSCINLHGLSFGSGATEGICIPIKLAGGKTNLDQVVIKFNL